MHSNGVQSINYCQTEKQVQLCNQARARIHTQEVNVNMT